MLRTCNLLAIVGIVLLALAMTSAVYVISATIAGRELAVAITVVSAFLFGLLWFALPLLRRSAEHRR